MDRQRTPLVHHLHDFFFPHERNGHRPHLFRSASVLAIAVFVVALETGYVLQADSLSRSGFLASVLPGALVALTNADRSAEGQPTLTEDALLDRAAQAAADDMAASGYFSHVSPSGKSPWQWLDDAGYRYSYAGQNLAVNFTDSVNVETAWMASPTHRANIVKGEYTQVGFGTASGMYEGQPSTFVVAFFATPARAAAAVVTAAPAAVPVATTTRVLAAETAPAVVPAPVRAPAWYDVLISSPWQALAATLASLFAVVAAAYAVVLRMRGRVPHVSVVVGGLVLLILLPASLLVSTLMTRSLALPAGGAAAAVGAAMLPY